MPSAGFWVAFRSGWQQAVQISSLFGLSGLRLLNNYGRRPLGTGDTPASAGLACGFLVQPGKRTVCGMLAGAGLSRL
jgi:hypothetical protein